MSAVDEYDDYYGNLINQYKYEQFHMEWRMKDGTGILIKDMKDSHIKNCINMLNRNILTETRRAWVDIFTDVQLKRRTLKLEKIKKNLENGNNGIYTR